MSPVHGWNSLTWAISGRGHCRLQDIKGECLQREKLLVLVADPDYTEIA
jgi:hypothetical protein